MKGRGRHYAIAKRELVERFGGKCQRCGYDRCMRALQFHHADDSEKKQWAGARKGSATWAEVNAHPERFLLLCANCHFEEHDRIDRERYQFTNCLSCGKEFRTDGAKQKFGRDRYCSRKCHMDQRSVIAAETIGDRLEKHIERTGECWQWTGYKASGCTPILVTKNPNGKYSPKPAARLVYEIHKGTMPERHKLWRTCETVGCVNPDHQQPRRRKGPRPKGRNGIRGSQQPTLFI
jgi:hypothetical protein